MQNESQEKNYVITAVKEQVKIAEWQRQIEEKELSGISTEEWCKLQGIGKSTYYYRLRRVREYICSLAGPMLPMKSSAAEERNDVVPICMPMNNSSGAFSELSDNLSDMLPNAPSEPLQGIVPCTPNNKVVNIQSKGFNSSPNNMDHATPPESRIEIRLGELNVSFTGNISSEALRAVVEALR